MFEILLVYNLIYVEYYNVQIDPLSATTRNEFRLNVDLDLYLTDFISNYQIKISLKHMIYLVDELLFHFGRMHSVAFCFYERPTYCIECRESLIT